MFRSGVMAAAFCCVAGGMSWGQQPAAQQTGDLTHFIPPQAMSAVVMHPTRVVENKSLQLLPWEVLQIQAQREWGFDPTRVESAVGLAISPLMGINPPVGVALRFADRESAADVVEQLLADDQQTIAGQTCSAWSRYPQVYVCQVDERTIVAGPPPLLGAMLAASDRTSPLKEQIESRDHQALVSAAISMADVRPMLQVALAQVPPQFEAAQRLVALTSIAQVDLQPGAEQPVAIRLRANSPRSAEELARTIEELRDLATRAMRQELSSEMEDDPELHAAYERYLDRLTGHFDRSLVVRREGEVVHLDQAMQGETVVIGTLAALLLPAVQSAREAAQRAQHSNNLRQIGLAMLNYHDVHGHFPPAYSVDDQGRPLLSWRVLILPFLEQQSLYERFRLDEPWNSEHNLPLADTMPAVYVNPQFADSSSSGATSVMGLRGKSTVLAGSEPIRISAITDGTSNTVFVIDLEDQGGVIWTAPTDFDLQTDDEKTLTLPPEGFQALFVDGSVRRIPGGLSDDDLHNLFTKDDGQIVPIDERFIAANKLVARLARAPRALLDRPAAVAPQAQAVTNACAQRRSRLVGEPKIGLRPRFPTARGGTLPPQGGFFVWGAIFRRPRAFLLVKGPRVRPDEPGEPAAAAQPSPWMQPVSPPPTPTEARRLLTTWVEEHGQAVFGFLVSRVRDRATADDLLQEVFCRAWETRGRYLEQGKVRAYLIRIADRLVRDRARWWRREQTARGRRSELATAVDELSPDAGLLRQERESQLWEALQSLSEAQQRTLLLRYFGELEFKEIAEQLELPVGTVLSHARRGLEQLRRLLVERSA